MSCTSESALRASHPSQPFIHPGQPCVHLSRFDTYPSRRRGIRVSRRLPPAPRLPASYFPPPSHSKLLSAAPSQRLRLSVLRGPRTEDRTHPPCADSDNPVTSSPTRKARPRPRLTRPCRNPPARPADASASLARRLKGLLTRADEGRGGVTSPLPTPPTPTCPPPAAAACARIAAVRGRRGSDRAPTRREGPVPR